MYWYENYHAEITFLCVMSHIGHIPSEIFNVPKRLNYAKRDYDLVVNTVTQKFQVQM